MIKLFKNDEFRFFLWQAGIYGFCIIMWAVVVFTVETNPFAAQESLRITSSLLLMLWIVFGTNYYLFVPQLFEAKENRTMKRWVYWLVNFALIFFFQLLMSMPDGEGIVWNEATRISVYMFNVIWMTVCYAMAGLAIGRRYFLQQLKIQKQLAEMKEQHTETELAWLKNQLNPHFLFNTLNNISSLTQIDADQAQDKIGQLSDLLRYALYETRNDMVPLKGETEFMRNYIDLMSLRCDTNVDIQTSFSITNPQLLIAPMLFLSPIENAFKHGVSSNRPSFIHISIKEREGLIDFTCQNSNYPKDDKNRSGSGIGKENMKRRLELLYPGCHKLIQGITNDSYQVKIKLWRK